jgi:eukaryotic-like serine/threonine-protein kinase
MASNPANEIDAAESLMGELADEYVQRLERGERPDIEEYLARWPGDARVVREVLASLKLVRLSSVAEISDAALETADAVGQLGDFRLLREIGRGGMGVVYEAEQQSLGRRVALKILPFAGMLDPRQIQRFKNEALAAAQLNHPHIVDVIAVGCERGVHFYAMRLIDGPSLAEVIAELRQKEGSGDPEGARRQDEGTEVCDPVAHRSHHAPHDGSQISHHAEHDAYGSADNDNVETTTTALTPALSRGEWEKVPIQNPKSKIQNRSTAPIAGISTHPPREYYRSVARLMADAAEALDHAHQLGVVHRDIKPSNLMLDARGEVWITDFGLARIESNTEMTMTGDLLGTLCYMSPEQASGDRRIVDHRTDVYSLGATLYELLALRPAFAGTDRRSLLRQIADTEPVAPRKFNRSLPAELETIVLKTLEKNPADRYRTAGELADDLRRFLEHRPILARRSRVAAHLKALWRRHQVLFVAVLATLLVASSVGSVLVWRQRQEAIEQRGLVLAREADLRQRVYAGDIRAAHQAWQRGDVARVRELLDRYAGVAGDDVRDFAWHYLSSLLAARPAPLAVLRPGHRNIYCVQFSPDGELLAAACGDGHVQLWNVSDWSSRHTLAAHKADADCVAFSPDSKLLASGGEDGWLRLWNVDNGALIRSIDARQKDTLTIAISSDGQTLASGGIDGMVRFWRLSDGYLRGEFRASSGRVQHLTFSPDGAKLATAGGDANAMIVDAATHAHLVTLPGQSSAAYAVGFSAKGDQLALGSGSGLVTLVDTSRGHTEDQFGNRAGQIRAVVFSPTHPILASAGQTGVVDLWDTQGRSLAAKLYGHQRRIWSLCFSPDGNLLASGGDDGSVHIWDPDADSGLVQGVNEQPIYDVKFGPGGHRVITADDSQRLVAWDVPALMRVAESTLPDTRTHELAYSPDRQKLAVRTQAGEVWLGDASGGGLTRFDTGLATPPDKLPWRATRCS